MVDWNVASDTISRIVESQRFETRKWSYLVGTVMGPITLPQEFEDCYTPGNVFG